MEEQKVQIFLGIVLGAIVLNFLYLRFEQYVESDNPWIRFPVSFGILIVGLLVLVAPIYVSKLLVGS